MKKALLSLVALTLGVAVVHAQQVGDTEQAVIKVLGNPPLNRTSGDRQIWMYPNGTKVVLKGGVVVEAKIGNAQPATTSEDASMMDATPRVTSPTPTVARTPSPAAVRPQSIRTKAPFKRSVVGLLLAVVAYGVIVVCGIMILVAAFRTSVLWGLASMFIPFASFIFVVTHWAETKKPFLLTWLVGFPLLIVSIAIDFAR